MENAFRVEMANGAPDWAGVLDQRLVERIVDRLPTKRHWQIEEVVEAGRAGWVASAAEGNLRYVLALSIPVGSAENPPGVTIACDLVAEVSRHDADRLRLPLGMIMLGTGVLCGTLAWHFRLPAFWIFVALLAGIVPVGLVLGVVVLRPLAAKRHRGPIPTGRTFIQEVAVVVDQEKQRS
jgi:hypothetical protein